MNPFDRIAPPRFLPRGLLLAAFVAGMTWWAFGGATPAAAAESLSAPQLYRSLASARSLRQFSGSRTLYVLYDPQCPVCETMFERMVKVRETAREAGVSAAWVPVAFLNERSNPQGQTQLKRGFGELKAHFRGEPSEPSDDDRLREIIEGHTELMRRCPEATGTPTLVFRTDERVHVVSGAPPTNVLEKILRAVR